MTTLVATRSVLDEPDLADASHEEIGLVPALVEVLACGTADRGDDGAAIAALAGLESELPPDVTVRLVDRLDIDDLLTVPVGAGAVVVDTVTGVDPGWVVEIPFTGLVGRESGIHARSSVALARPETVGLASMIRGRPLTGVIVAIGGQSFGPGEALSWPVATGLCTFRLAIVDAIDRVRAHALASVIDRG
jgi:hypothetical protein